MASDGVNKLKLQLVYGQHRQELFLILPPEEAGELLTVHHLKANVEKHFDIPAANQKIIFKGKTLVNPSDSLVKQGLKNGSKVMLIGKKPPPANDKQIQTMKSVDDSLAKLATKLSDITYDLDGIHRGYLQKDLQLTVLSKIRNQLSGIAEHFMKLLESLDTLSFKEDDKGANIRRKNLVDRIQTLLNRADALTQGICDMMAKCSS